MTDILLPIAIMLAAAKLGGEFCERFLKQPAVLGEILVGVLIGKSALGWIDGQDHVLQSIAEMGAVLLLFEVGLESDLGELFRVGTKALWVAILGVILPLAMGYGLMIVTGHSSFESIFVGAALTATSVGITARVFADLGVLKSYSASIVLGAAVIDDVLGLIVLATVSGIAKTGSFSLMNALQVTGIALLFLVGAIVIGLRATPMLLRWAHAMQTRAAVSSAAVVIAFILAALAHLAGLAPIVGAFAAGLVLAQTEQRVEFEDQVRSIADIFSPVFFVMMGASISLSSFNSTTVAIAAIMFVVAVLSKTVAGLSLPAKGVSKWMIAIGMVPRGEVGLIFASIGLTNKLIGDNVYTAIVIVVLATTMITPPLLKVASKNEITAT